MTLTEFLLARIAEDEKAARRAAAMRYDHPGDSPWESARLAVQLGAAFSSSEHIARHDPARILRECEATRAIVEAEAEADQVAGAAGGGSFTYEDGRAEGLEYAVRILAAIYSDHPDYQKEWKP